MTSTRGGEYLQKEAVHFSLEYEQLKMGLRDLSPYMNVHTPGRRGDLQSKRLLKLILKAATQASTEGNVAQMKEG